MIGTQSYDFPVALEPAFSRSGKQAPKMQLVVRTDVDEPIAAVGSRYRLIPHKEIVETAAEFANNFGTPEQKHWVAKNGKILTSEFTFMDKTLAVGKGDMVGFRLYAENNYGLGKKLKIRVGGIVLACMNGMISHKAVYDLEYSHTHSTAEIKWPDPETIWGEFVAEGKHWNKLAEYQMNNNEYGDTAQAAVEQKIIPEVALDGIEKDTDRTAWSLYNRFTYHITHSERKSATKLGKITRLSRVNDWFEERYA